MSSIWDLQKQLHGLLVEYEGSGQPFTIESFVHWIQDRNQTSEEAPGQYYDPETNIIYGNADGTAGQLISRLYRLSRFTAKEAILSAGLASLDEFSILSTIVNQPGLGKKEVCTKALVETTTGFEILKRFKNDGWIEEQQSPTDKRSKLIYPTQVGLQVLFTCYKNHEQLPELLLGLTATEKEQLISIMDRLNRVHTARHLQ